jgi:hypothetical protein
LGLRSDGTPHALMKGFNVVENQASVYGGIDNKNRKVE